MSISQDVPFRGGPDDLLWDSVKRKTVPRDGVADEQQPVRSTLIANINCPGVPRRLVAARRSAALCKWFQYCVIIFRTLVWRHRRHSELPRPKLSMAAAEPRRERDTVPGCWPPPKTSSILSISSEDSPAPASPVWEMQQIKRRHFVCHLFTPPTPQQNTHGAACDDKTVTGNVHFHPLS